jgi:DNA repair exonuclease SbcCD ATPase subunit
LGFRPAFPNSLAAAHSIWLPCFLDEGFSSLDAETQNVAIEALQARQQGDRMLGVISHVTDLAERLPSEFRS